MGRRRGTFRPPRVPKFSVRPARYSFRPARYTFRPSRISRRSSRLLRLPKITGFRRRRRSSKVENAFGVAFLIAFGLLWLYSSQPALAAVVGALAALVAAFVFYLRRRRHAAYRAALLESGIQNPLQLTGVQFEEFCALLLGRCGWSVEMTRATGDYGADIIARRAGITMAVQCKRYAGSVGVKAVQEAHGAVAYYQVQRSAVMSTGDFTRAAIELAERTGTVLIVPGRYDPHQVLIATP